MRTAGVVLDRFGDLIAEVVGEVVTGPADLRGRRRPPDPPPRGPVTLHPTVWVIDEAHLIELTSADAAVAAGDAATVRP